MDTMVKNKHAISLFSWPILQQYLSESGNIDNISYNKHN